MGNAAVRNEKNAIHFALNHCKCWTIQLVSWPRENSAKKTRQETNHRLHRLHGFEEGLNGHLGGDSHCAAPLMAPSPTVFLLNLCNLWLKIPLALTSNLPRPIKSNSGTQ
jgi:hypothetical protein